MKRTSRTTSYALILISCVATTGCIDLITDGAKDAVTDTTEAIIEELFRDIIEGTLGTELPGDPIGAS